MSGSRRSPDLLRLSQLNQDHTAGLLHDTVGQNLSALGLELGVLLLDFKDTPELAGRVSHLQVVLEETIDKVRELSRLNSSMVDHSGLRFALEHLIETRRASSDVEFGLEYAARYRFPAPPREHFSHRGMFHRARLYLRSNKRSGANLT